MAALDAITWYTLSLQQLQLLSCLIGWICSLVKCFC